MLTMNGTLPNGMRGEYQRADATMTLREGLAEYYRVNPGLSEPAGIKDLKSATYFHNHDSTHVVFGTHTGPLHEGVNDLWTIFGVDIRFKDYAGGFFATDESKQIAKEFDIKTIVPLLWGTVRSIPEIRRRTKAMTKKWPWVPPEEYLDRPLSDLRREFGIEVFQPELLLGIAP
jgi:hypothetical protein